MDQQFFSVFYKKRRLNWLKGDSSDDDSSDTSVSYNYNSSSSSETKAEPVSEHVAKAANAPHANFLNSVKEITKCISADKERNDEFFCLFETSPYFNMLMVSKFQLSMLHKLYYDNTKIIVHLDRTGSAGKGKVVPNFMDGLKKELFLFSLLVKVYIDEPQHKKKQHVVPLMELITSHQNGEGLLGVLNKYKSVYMSHGIVLRPFKCVVTDYCSDQINAILSCFNDGMSLTQYLAECHSFVTEDEAPQNPNHNVRKMVLIRLCNSYLTRMIYNDVNSLQVPSIKPVIRTIIAQFMEAEDYYDILAFSVKFFALLIIKDFNLDNKEFVKEEKKAYMDQEDKKFGRLHGWNRKNEIANVPVEIVESKFHTDFTKVYETVAEKLDKQADPEIDKFIRIFIKKYFSILPLWTKIITKLILGNELFDNFCGERQKFLSHAPNEDGKYSRFKNKPIKLHEFAEVSRKTIDSLASRYLLETSTNIFSSALLHELPFEYDFNSDFSA